MVRSSGLFLKALVLVCGICCLISCSSTKSKTGVDGSMPGGVYTKGVGGFGNSNFGDENGPNNPNRLKAPYDQTYYFGFDKFDVDTADVESINVQASYLVAHPNAKIRLEGNADDRGSREYNVALGWKRAKAVGALLEQQGVAKSQIAMVSYGKEKPVAFGHDEDSYRLNRRVNLVYEAK